ncbi:hypothetical protein [Kitasatospora camelliae]|uniref:Uncharacterized protein n=1 Tax=Kitasatospora camelliae TaxID=3156397 RepID=A0AAU8JRP6_9ACTN
MAQEDRFHLDHLGCSVTMTVRLGGHRELELLVDGHEVGFERVHGHHAETHRLAAVLPSTPPVPIEVEVALPGRTKGEPVCVLVVGEERLPMPRNDIPRRARPIEADYYG